MDLLLRHFTFRWLKRFYILVAVKLVLLAILLSSARILFLGVEDYKEQAIDWLTSEYQVNISVDDISAGIDFSGMVLTLNNVQLLDSEDLPFELKFELLFLHLNFWDSVMGLQLNFNSISLQGADLTIKSASQRSDSEKSQLTIKKLKNIFLTQLKSFSIKNSRVNFTDQLGQPKTVIIEQLRWLNKDDNHQGTGNVSFPDTLGKNSLKVVVDLSSTTEKELFSGSLYLQADNLNVTDYLIEQVNKNAEVMEAVIGFDAWVNFSNAKIERIQLQLKESKFSWSQLNQYHSWGLNSGLLQLTNSDSGWLLDSYDLDISRNDKQWDPLIISGQGDKSNMRLDLKGLTLKDIIPFYLLHSDLTAEQITSLRSFDVDANIQQIGLSKNTADAVQFSVKLGAFKNRPVGAIPGLSNANIELAGSLNKGTLDIKLPKQKLYFDGQFSRSMPIKSADIALQWLQTETGLKLFSEQTLLTTNDIDTNTQFSLFLPNEKAQNHSPFLSLYSKASLNDAGKVRYYLPKKALGKSVFDYLEPTLKKGHVKGAKILWYGAFNHYPYVKNNGIFQAWIPLRDAQYDFYGQWKGLKKLDLDLFFENDRLLMDAKRAYIGGVKVAKLSAKVDHLNPKGMLIIEAKIKEDAQKISSYLKASPLKNSVGKALSVIDVRGNLSGDITVTVPFKRDKLHTKIEGKIRFHNNDLNFEISDDLKLPLKAVNGSFTFINGDLIAKNLKASLFKQPLKLSFSTVENKKNYQVNANISAIWALEKLTNYQSILKPLQLSGQLNWLGKVKFTHQYSGGYQFDVALNSSTKGITSKLPLPFGKKSSHVWPTAIKISGSDQYARFKGSIKDKLGFEGQLNYKQGKQIIPYFNLTLGQSRLKHVDKKKQVINLNLNKLTASTWYDYWLDQKESFAKNTGNEREEGDVGLIALDEVNVDIKQLNFFNQPLSLFKAGATNHDGRWQAKIESDNLQVSAEYRSGIPVRFDLDIKKINFQTFDVTQLQKAQKGVKSQSENLRVDYPELFIECKSCVYKEIDLSPVSVHIYPTKKRLNIDYLKIGGESEFTHISGFWDQRRTNVIVDSEGDKNNSIVKRLGFTSPVYHQKAQLSGAFNWIGAPWQANFESLNGAFSAQLNTGSITEVSDKGARLLSVFSLDGIRRSLNLEFDNVFSKGFNFDELTLSGNIKNGVISNDDFYLNGSAGKIIGNGLIDLPNQDTNYRFSYSPAVTSSLPVLAAFAINPLTGAAVLMLTKILEPVVDTIIRVDFSVKGDLNNPTVKLVTRQRGKVKLENSEVLQEMSEQQNARKRRNKHGS